jgi:methionyl-tRNA formyltransferase
VNSALRIVFLGTPEFAVPSLRVLAERHDVAAVYTQPDRPKGRGNQLAESPVKVAAKELGLALVQPERLRRPESFAPLQAWAAEMMVVVGYGQIIPQNIIDLPRYGILNVHASLLPKYRGAAPIQWAIANGETETGVTIMQIDAGLDTGDMLLKERLAIGESETAAELSVRLAPLGAELLLEAIGQIEAGTTKREKQGAEEASLAPILKKEDGLVDWRRSAGEIYNRWRGFNPWPGAYTVFRGQQMSIGGARLAEATAEAPGRVWGEKRWLFAGCGGGTALELLEVQLAGKKRMSAEAFLNGYRLAENEMLGDKP